MSEAPRPAQVRSRRGENIKSALALAGIAAFAYVSITYGGGDETHFDDVIDSLVEARRKGAFTDPPEASRETLDALGLVAKSSAHRVVFAQSHSAGDHSTGRGCAGIELELPEGRRRVDALTELRENRWRFVEASTTRRCKCEGLEHCTLMQ